MRDDHCHIIWGVDDGSPDWQTTCKMVEGVRACGFTEVICTPHMRWADFDRSKVERHFEQLAAYAPDINWTLGYEVYYERLLKLGLEHAPEYTIGESSTILLEFNSGASVPHDWERTFYKLQSSYGLDIVLAHPERYQTVIANFDIAYRIRECGVKMQVSAGDLLGGLFNKCARAAKRLVREGLADSIVTDAHTPQDYEDFRKATLKISR